MSTVTIGRTLDAAGDPIEGTGFDVDPDGWLADRIADRAGPITSHPTRPVWGIPLEASGDEIRTLSVLGPGYGGPPEHHHHQSEESFEVREGTVAVTLDGTDRRASAGDTVTVETGVRHTFRNDGTERAVMLTTIHDPGRLRQVLPTLGGLAHDDRRDPDDPLQRALIAKRLERNTVFATDPMKSALTDALAPVAHLAGYRGAYDEYARPEFWRRHVEQPTFSR